MTELGKYHGRKVTISRIEAKRAVLRQRGRYDPFSTPPSGQASRESSPPREQQPSDAGRRRAQAPPPPADPQELPTERKLVLLQRTPARPSGLEQGGKLPKEPLKRVQQYDVSALRHLLNSCGDREVARGVCGGDGKDKDVVDKLRTELVSCVRCEGFDFWAKPVDSLGYVEGKSGAAQPAVGIIEGWHDWDRRIIGDPKSTIVLILSMAPLEDDLEEVSTQPQQLMSNIRVDADLVQVEREPSGGNGGEPSRGATGRGRRKAGYGGMVESEDEEDDPVYTSLQAKAWTAMHSIGHKRKKANWKKAFLPTGQRNGYNQYAISMQSALSKKSAPLSISNHTVGVQSSSFATISYYSHILPNMAGARSSSRLATMSLSASCAPMTLTRSATGSGAMPPTPPSRLRSTCRQSSVGESIGFRAPSRRKGRARRCALHLETNLGTDCAS